MIDLKAEFDKDRAYSFAEMPEPYQLSRRKDLCAFLILDRLMPNNSRDIVEAAEHDMIYLDADLDELAQVATANDIMALQACGVMYSDHDDSLTMYA